MKPAIRVENLAKLYRIGSRQSAGYRTLREALVDAAAVPWRRLRAFVRTQARPRTDADQPETIWALKDVSFQVQPGEVVGIIGHNGAGKSTLLKILSRVTEPTSGRAEMRGRVGSLLEIGTGFHPELTGRENIYLNGAILGMSRREMERKFDEIVAFSGVEKFIDTPVKRYSSGMHVRLGFAVAAHLDPEILIVDEVLAVGDIGFQRKCMGKLKDVTGEGRTVVFVSHNMGAIASLCSRVILLDQGQARFAGDVGDGIDLYTKKLLQNTNGQNPIQILAAHFQTRKPWRVTNLELLDKQGAVRTTVATGDHVCFRIHFELKEPLQGAGFRLRIFSEERQELLRLSTDPISGYHVPPLQEGRGVIDCVLPQFPFTGGRYFLDVGLTRAMIEPLHDVENAAVLDVQPSDVYGSGTLLTTKTCFVVCAHKWEYTRIKSPVPLAALEKGA